MLKPSTLVIFGFMTCLPFVMANHGKKWSCPIIKEDRQLQDVTRCEFPFKHNGKTYEDCTDDVINEDEVGKTKESFKWCATRIDDDGRMKTDKWGRCDLSKCEWVPDDQNSMSEKSPILFFIFSILAILGVSLPIGITFYYKKGDNEAKMD